MRGDRRAQSEEERDGETSGDTVYVAIGSKTADNFDTTNVSYQIDVVPEPLSWGLISVGIFGLLARRRRWAEACGQTVETWQPAQLTPTPDRPQTFVEMLQRRRQLLAEAPRP